MILIGVTGTSRRAAMASAARGPSSLWNCCGSVCSGDYFLQSSRRQQQQQRQQYAYTSVVVSNVYPDVSASAACVRTNSILHGLAGLSMPRNKRDREHNNCSNNGGDNDGSGGDGNGDREGSPRKPIEKNIETTVAKNRVYYATSVDATHKTDAGDGDVPFGRVHDNLHPPSESSSRNHPAATTIQMIHLPPNRSDLAKDFWGKIDSQNTTPSSRSTTSTAQTDGKSGHHNGSSTKAVVDPVDLVVFDRFYVEEAHSFRFRRTFPSAALVLDMQDMHSLRWGRQDIVEAWDEEHKHKQEGSNRDPLGCLPRVLDYLPTLAETKNDRFIRELASIHRSDLVLVCSPKELHLLQSVYGIPNKKLCLASFFVEENSAIISRDTTRKSLPRSPSGDHALPPRFVFCGGFKHAPNSDAVRILIDFVWPRLRSELPASTLHIYGAFCPDQLMAHNNNNNNNSKNHGIHVHGYEPDLASIFGKDGGILLAPLRFGAGIKGKIIDAWTFGMPVVTTPIGSEGMTIDRDCGTVVFGGSIASTMDSFCEKAIDLAQNPEEYFQAQTRGRFLLRELFSASKNWEEVQKRLLEVLEKDSLTQKRQRDYTQAMLWHQSLRSTEYFSRWVELKETVMRDKQQRGGISTNSPNTT